MTAKDRKKIAQLQRRLKAVEVREDRLQSASAKLSEKWDELEEKRKRLGSLYLGVPTGPYRKAPKVTPARKKAIEKAFAQIFKQQGGIRKKETWIRDQLLALDERAASIEENIRRVKAGKRLDTDEENPYYLVSGNKRSPVKTHDLIILKADRAKDALERGKQLYASKGYTNMKAKKQRNPSPAQIRARKAFAKMAKARSKAAKVVKTKKRNPSVTREDASMLRAYVDQYVYEGLTLQTILNLLRQAGFNKSHLAIAKKAYAAAKKKNPSATQTLKIAGRAAKKAVRSTLDAGSNLLKAGAKALANPTKRIKVKNSYIDLVIKGQAKKTPSGWQVGKKTFAQGRGTTKVSSSYYLDKATGLVYSKRQRNPKKVVSVKAKKIVVVNSRKTRKAAKRRRNPQIPMLALVNKSISKAAQNRKEFAGEYRRDVPLRYPEGTPKGLSKLGKLILIKTELATITPINNQTWLVRDIKGKLHIGTTSQDGVIWHGPAESFGKVKQIEYEDVKRHLGYHRLTQFYHHMGEENGIQPTLHADGKGGLKFRGGDYSITPEGVVN